MTNIGRIKNITETKTTDIIELKNLTYTGSNNTGIIISGGNINILNIINGKFN
ncbi:hypothetical protein [Methanobrevibacter arboriphilus]|uniref:hypothetical protein n=1 Tax=Methanobrevibacter arboriphilus TaxID=39441 RepID=UPI001301E3D5|nr:hypothetical protein [Methanobrevibacter arboriphilus]